MATPAPRIAPVSRDPVRERLAGKTILLTGASGFLGKAVLATLMRVAPEIGEVRILLRAGSDEDARRRLVDEVLAAEAFHEGTGATDQRLDPARLRALAGDLAGHAAAAPRRSDWAGVDTVIHCAATVSFEEPLDDAIVAQRPRPRAPARAAARSGLRRRISSTSRPPTWPTDRPASCSRTASPITRSATCEPEALAAEARGWRDAAERESGEDGGALSIPARRGAGRGRPSRPGPRGARRAAAPALGPGPALARGAQQGPGARLAGHLRAEQGARRTDAERTGGRRDQGDDRPPDDHRVGATRPAARLARGDQGRRPADPRLRRARAHPPRRPRLEHDRHRPRRPRGPRLRRGCRPPAARIERG